MVEWEADIPQLQPKANEGLYSVGWVESQVLEPTLLRCPNALKNSMEAIFGLGGLGLPMSIRNSESNKSN